MKIEMWPLANVKPYEKNPRKNEGAIDAVAKSIAEFGFRVPIVVDGEGWPIGAVGVTGDTSDNDEICALSGIEATGLTAA